ncbi:hypothetical protein C2G38_2247565 [Gigaspora rosea]|uniref:C2H2-type domain-containing protein n=1 Tax=Gigaspora rosea TaxID=44941 RepID=A0A397V8C7_9GLOM|nr:hypothetical protein C2G38_2247565 [Gigaspora rosea]
MSKANHHKLDLDNLNFKRTYTFEEFELVNEQLKTRTLEIDGTPVDLFEFNKGKLLPMPQKSIHAPDVAFIPKNIYRSLDHQQQWSFKGQSFTPTFIVEVAVVQESYQEFNDLDQKFREIYFEVSGVVYRTSHGWNNVNGGSILPGFTLEVQKIDDTISQDSSESSSENDEITDCPKCNATFSNYYDFMKHFENSHARRWRKRE